MNAKEFFKRNSFSIILTGILLFVLACIPTQIKVSLVSKATISPRLFPYFSTIGALICCVLSIAADTLSTVKEARAGTFQVQESDDNVSYLRAVICIVLLVAWYLVLKKIGFIISTIVVIFILSYMLGNRNKVSLIVFPVVFTVGIYFVFSQLLHVNLPEILF